MQVINGKKTYRKPGAALLIWGIPPELKQAFKKACKRQGCSMQDTVQNLLEKYTKEHAVG